MSVPETQDSTFWVDVSPRAMRRENFAPYSVAEIGHLFDWGENPNGASSHIAPYRGKFIVDIVEIEENAVHQPSKPGDEIVYIANGVLILTTDANNTEQVFKKGEAVLIPQGWAGLYRVLPEDGPFLEFTIVPANYFDPLLKPKPSGLTPIRLPLQAQAGREVLYTGGYEVASAKLDRCTEFQGKNGAEEVVIIRSGEMTFYSATGERTLRAGDAFVIPEGYEGAGAASPDYSVLAAKWLGQ